MIENTKPDNFHKIRENGGVDEIFDLFRKSWVRLTPEEWVRQSLLLFLVNKGYPASMIGVEKMVRFGERKRRYDAVVFDRSGSPWMLIECKAESEKLDEKVINQLLAYQSQLQAKYLLITNGKLVRTWVINGINVSEMDEIPDYIETT
jgi:hypothetical protein